MLVRNVSNGILKANFGAMLVRPKPGGQVTPNIAAECANLKGFYYKPGNSIKEQPWLVIATRRGSAVEKSMIKDHESDGAISISPEEARRIFPGLKIFSDEVIGTHFN